MSYLKMVLVAVGGITIIVAGAVAEIKNGYVGNLLASVADTVNNDQSDGKDFIVIPLPEKTERKTAKNSPRVNSETITYQTCSYHTDQSPVWNLVLFNEIAWMGSAEGANNEWLELKKSQAGNVNLSGWQIINETERIKIVIPQGTFLTDRQPSYLLIRGQKTATDDRAVDLIFTGAIRNADEGLRLFDNNCRLIDEVTANPNWPAGDNETKQPMVRLADLSWYTKGGKISSATSSTETLVSAIATTTGTSASVVTAQNQQTQIPAETKPTSEIIIDHPPTITTDREFEVKLLVKNLVYASYDVKISVADGTKNISDIYNRTEGAWQSSTYYVQNYFAGNLIEAPFRLRIRSDSQQFSGSATVSARIRENGKSQYWEQNNNVIIQPLPPTEEPTPTSVDEPEETNEEEPPPADETANSPPTTDYHIVIAEIQITGGSGKTTNDFIRIFNPLPEPFNLKGYRLVKRTKTGTSDTLLKSWTSDAFIPAGGYYVWANSSFVELTPPADVTTTGSIANDNGLAIRFGPNDTGEIIDALAWGVAENIFAESQPYPQNPDVNQILKRKFLDGLIQDTDNNAADFDIF